MLRGALVVIVMLAATGCSGDEAPEGAADERPRQVTLDGLASLYAGDHPGEDQTADGRCFAEELTDRVSFDRLREAGVVDEDGAVVVDVPSLPEDLARDWVDAQFACVDVVEQSAEAQRRLSKGKVDVEAYAACLREALPEDELKAAIVEALTGELDGEALAAFSDAQGACRRESTPPD